jgi:hypothetical protein
MRKLASAIACLVFVALGGNPAIGDEQEESSTSSNPNEQDRVTFSGLFYISYEQGERGGADVSDFFIHRAYLTARKEILPFLSARVTFDTSQDREGDGRGDMEVRLKYAFAEFDLGDWSALRGVYLEAGIVHMVWLDFEEHVNAYRMRDPMFMERSGIFNSADFGVTLAGSLGPDLGEEYRQRVNSKYSARHGSFAVGVYNGGGYHGDERNTNKVAEGRISYRPFPESLTGFQVSGLAIVGKGNQAGVAHEIPDWHTFNSFFSYEDESAVVTAQYVWGRGNQRGTWTEPDDPSEATPFSGWSLFGEAKVGAQWRIIGTYERFHRTAGENDFSFDRTLAAVGYDLGRENILLFDWDRRIYDDPMLSTDNRYQAVIQLKF